MYEKGYRHWLSDSFALYFILMRISRNVPTMADAENTHNRLTCGRYLEIVDTYHISTSALPNMSNNSFFMKCLCADRAYFQCRMEWWLVVDMLVIIASSPPSHWWQIPTSQSNMEGSSTIVKDDAVCSPKILNQHLICTNYLIDLHKFLCVQTMQK